MSLSQKHFGKVLVPWFNIAEWKFVYDLIYSDSGQDWPKALEILKIWKQRTPLLSAGVEGTLITLEALLVNTTHLSNYEISHIFSTSLVRFLNLCATNSDRQGTFYRTAMKNELPKWLITIRHEIAHSHKVPSLSMLELSLKFCLNWLKGKYWDIQLNKMSDFAVKEVESTIIQDALVIYIFQNELSNKYGKKDWKRSIKNLEEHINEEIDRDEAVNYALEALTLEIKNNKESSCDKIFDLLINKFVFLTIPSEENDCEVKEIPSTFLEKWNSLLNIFHNTKIMPDLVLALLRFINSHKNNISQKEIASFWIKAIFNALINEDEKSGLSFDSENNSLKNPKLLNEILDQVHPVTINFINEILEYNEVSSEFAKDSISLITAYHSSSNCVGDKIYTVQDLNIQEEENLEEMPPTPRQQSGTRWTLIEDTSLYNNLPLGVLPHQRWDKNPLLFV